MLLSHTYLHRVPARRPRNQANADTSYISLACVSELLRVYHFPLKLSLIWRIEVVFNNVVGATIKPASVSLSIHLCITILCETRCGYMEGSYFRSTHWIAETVRPLSIRPCSVTSNLKARPGSRNVDNDLAQERPLSVRSGHPSRNSVLLFWVGFCLSVIIYISGDCRTGMGRLRTSD